MRFRQSASAPSGRSAEVLAGRYRLDALIGSGGAADVHRGFDLRLKRPVAVKVFRTGADADMEERFGNEAVILARLQHPGLVTVYDAGRHDGRAYLVMQLIEGPTLKARIAEGTLSPGETAALGAHLARALAHAHEAGIVHRDVKPSNIILDASSRPHLTDFGISRLLDATTRTAPGALVGTAAYLSPEQVLGRSAGPPADVYALGLALLECLTGRLEYDGGPLEAAIARLHRPPVLPDSLPEELAALLRDMTDLDEQARPSAHACARRLAALTTLATPADTAAGPAPLPVPSPAVTSVIPSVIPGEAPERDTDFTHRHSSPAAAPAAGDAASKATPARGRVLVAGGAAALAAVMAAAFTVSDGTGHQGSGDGTPRAVSRPSTEAGSPDTSAGRNTSGPADPTPSPRGVSTGRLRDAALARNSGPSSTSDPASDSAAPRRKPATGRSTAPGTTTRPPHSGPAGTPGSRTTGTSGTATPTETGTRTPGGQSGTSEEPEKPQKKTREEDKE
ncbi:protein kinase [Streptomyces echinoruber]|uniref:Serine/threonine protein kinase n=1 Tax=Streptomyces echinoruber TaxID=68898 RepID=A0A918V8M8_9ACTN|nr:serine/threonine-protein kinase [Streptomyces echinoruber]GGZ78900.1 serine/threonine protein kinase [Streptomyces echinoruber]